MGKTTQLEEIPRRKKTIGFPAIGAWTRVALKSGTAFWDLLERVHLAGRKVGGCLQSAEVFSKALENLREKRMSKRTIRNGAKYNGGTQEGIRDKGGGLKEEYILRMQIVQSGQSQERPERDEK